MSGTYAVESVNAQFINSSFIDRLESGLTKEASNALSTFTRQILRETGFARKIFTPQAVVAADLDRDIDETPRILVEKEPDSTAASFGLHGRPEISYWSAQRYPVYFHKVSSPDFRKTKGEIMTYKHNIQQILQENSIKDMQKQEDSTLINRLTDIAVDPLSGNAGVQDYTTAGFGVRTLMDLIKVLSKTNQKPGRLLMNHSTYLSLLSRQARIIGSDLAGVHFKGGDMTHFYGFEIITTIKHDLLSTNPAAGINDPGFGDRIFVFAPEQYLGQFFSLIEPTVFVKTEADVIEFQTYELVGLGIGNTKGFAIGKFDHSVDADLI